MSDLEQFLGGFAEGWHQAPKQKNIGPVYERAYDRGREARDRHENGGEIVAGKRRA